VDATDTYGPARPVLDAGWLVASTDGDPDRLLLQAETLPYPA